MSDIMALLLYGSRARGDGNKFSDVDLLGIASTNSIEKPFDANGVSLHLYPLDWMEAEAVNGSLFLLHIVHESIAITDPYDLLGRLKNSFRFKDDYYREMENGCRIVSAVINLDDNIIKPSITRRYFWGLRTALIAAAASEKSPLFSASSLEERFQINGLASHIHGRATASPEACKIFGSAIYERLLGKPVKYDRESVKENLRYIFELGGVATATAGEIIYDLT